MNSENSFPPLGMTSEEFRRRGKELIDYIADYYDNINQLKPLSQVEPNYLRELLPENAPEEPDNFDAILKDIETKIVPGVTHWQSGNFYGYFPGNSSYPGILGEMYSAMFNGIGFSWINGPAMTELETITLDWLGKLIGLDASFLSFNADGSLSSGGGVIQGTASEATIVAMLAARCKAIENFKAENLEYTQDDLIHFSSKLIGYGTDQTHSSGEKASMIINCRFRGIQTADNGSLTKDLLENAIQEDREKGLIPFFIIGTFGTTAIGATDDFVGISEASQAHNLWFHLDAAYAGAALICPEYRNLAPGMNLADSFVFNPHKWLLVNFDCSAIWFKNSYYVKIALSIHRDYYKNSATDSGLVRDYKDWQIPLGRRFRALKLFLVMRMYGAKGLRQHIRRSVGYTEWLETELSKDDRFKILFPRTLSLLVFQLSMDSIQALSKTNLDSEQLSAMHKQANLRFSQFIIESGEIFLTTASVKNSTAIRVAIGSPSTDKSCMEKLLCTLKSSADLALAEILK
ncbi:hypothetical protein BB561_000052 [Smittium simulii]|uniref:Aromatic-L-amino-acid decarboxylase n=1 Tax=Smittium simulii TaxID=133385 RepID=A0A2T9Z0R6_9FUNG|nr:hypothetical protein BB561_000052 [Smittium simulii]